MFKYLEFPAETNLVPFVKKVWVMDNRTNRDVVQKKNILPNGCFNIAVITGSGFILRQSGKEHHISEGVYWCGQATEAVGIDILSHSQAIMIQLFPWTPSYFGANNLFKWTDRVVRMQMLGLENILTPGLALWQLLRQLTVAFRPHFCLESTGSIIANCTRRIMESQGQVSISALATMERCSTRHLQNLFKEQVGVSPKKLSIILRLRKAVDELAFPDGEIMNLTHLALSFNYYDQPHFNQDFRSMIKTSPSHFNPKDYMLAFKQEG